MVQGKRNTSGAGKKPAKSTVPAKGVQGKKAEEESAEGKGAVKEAAAKEPTVKNTPRTRPPAQSKGARVSIIALGALLALAVLWAFIATFTDFGRAMHKAPAQKQQSVQINRSVSGKSVEQDQKDALAAATKLLNLSAKSPTGATVSARLQSLDKGDFSVMDKGVSSRVQFSAQATEEFKSSTYQTLVTLYSVISEKNKKTTLAPLEAQSWEDVSLDQKLGVAWVPLSVFSPGGASFSLEMVHVDGAWKLAPYTLVDSIRFSAAVSQGSSGVAEPSPSASK